MGLLGRITKRQSAEDSEDLDFDDEMVDSLDMPGEEGGSRGGILGKVLKRRRKGESEDAEDAEETDQDEDPGDAASPAAPEEDSPVQAVRLEGIPDVRPVGDSNADMMAAQEQTGPAPGSAEPAGSGTGQPSPAPGAQPAANSSPAEGNTPIEPAPGAQPAANSSPAEGNTPVEPAPATEGDTTESSSDPDGEDLALSLKDIFTEQEEVDESLRDLADFVEDTLAQDLADELREFLEELEARQK